MTELEAAGTAVIVLAGAGGILGLGIAARMALRVNSDERKPDPAKAIVVPVGKGKTKAVKRLPRKWRDKLLREEQLPTDENGEVLPLVDPLEAALIESGYANSSGSDRYFPGY